MAKFSGEFINGSLSEKELNSGVNSNGKESKNFELDNFLCFGIGNRFNTSTIDHVYAVVIIVKNLGINIPAAIERKTRMDSGVSMRVDNFSIQAKKDFDKFETMSQQTLRWYTK
jgi:hypothetical protein